MIRIQLPSRALHGAWLEAMREFEGETLHGFSTFGYEVEELARPDRFAHWLAREVRQRVEGQDGFVPATVWWIVDDESPERVLGSIHLRHELNEWLLAEGGHNAGIVSEPGHPRRSFRIGTRHHDDRYRAPDAWAEQAERREGSWWIAWRDWLVVQEAREGEAVLVPPPAMGAPGHGLPPLAPAPGGYVLMP